MPSPSLTRAIVSPVVMLAFAACQLTAQASGSLERNAAQRNAALELQRADSLLGNAWNARNIDAVLDFYDESVRVQWPDDIARTKQTMREHLVRLFGDRAYSAGGSVDRREIAQSGDLAYTVGRLQYWRSSRTVPGKVEVVSGTWSVVWAYRNGRWRIVSEMSASGEVRQVQ